MKYQIVYARIILTLIFLGKGHTEEGMGQNGGGGVHYSRLFEKKEQVELYMIIQEERTYVHRKQVPHVLEKERQHELVLCYLKRIREEIKDILLN